MDGNKKIKVFIGSDSSMQNDIDRFMQDKLLIDTETAANKWGFMIVVTYKEKQTY